MDMNYSHLGITFNSCQALLINKIKEESAKAETEGKEFVLAELCEKNFTEGG
jgi:hypothetical protein